MNTFRLPFSALARALRIPGLLLVLYAVLLTFTVPLALGFRNIVHAAMGTSQAYDVLLTQFDFTIFADFLKQNGQPIGALLIASLMFALVFVLIGTFLAGGIITILRQSERRFSLTLFFVGCARYFSRFLRLLLIFAVVFGGLVLLAAIIFGATMVLLSGQGETEVPVVAMVAGGKMLFALVLLFFLMVVDYAKVIAVETESSRMLRVAWQALRFVVKNLPRAFAVHLVLIVVALALVGVYWLLDGVIGMVSPLTIVVMAAIQQLFVIARLWLRTAFFSAEIGVYQSVKLREAPFIDTPPPSEEPGPLYA
jgi:hypothetical protein